jgi:hypothetical protein
MRLAFDFSILATLAEVFEHGRNDRPHSGRRLPHSSPDRQQRVAGGPPVSFSDPA